MKNKRIIPCLDTINGKVVKGVNFENIKEIADPVELAMYYDEQGADEIVLYDITASVEGRGYFMDLLKNVAPKVSKPIAVGGGIKTVADFEKVLENGASKVSINSGVIQNPALIADAAKVYGSEIIVFAMDVKLVDGVYRVFEKGGTQNTGIDALEWAKQGEANGAGEIVLNSIDTDGVKQGFDLPMLKAFREAVNIPIVASGGAGKMEDFKMLFETLPDIEAGLAASIFHYKEVSIKELKEYLTANQIPVNR